MSVTALEKTVKAATGTAKSGEISYDAPYRITLSTGTEGPAAIFDYLRATPSAPWLGRTFSYGDDTDGSAVCTEISSPTREKGSADPWQWLFTAKYSTKTDQQEAKPDENGELTNNPLDWRPEVRVGWAQHQVPAETAIYRSGFTHANNIFLPGQSYAPQNSALEIYDPPLPKDFSRATYSCKFYREYYNASVATQIIDAVNTTAVQFQNFIKIIGGFAAYTLKVADVQGHPHRESREIEGFGQVMLDYYEITVELQYRRDGWRERVPDRGFRRIVNAGDPDGFGSTISLTDLLAGNIAPNKAIVGIDGVPITTPILLNGDGEPKQQTDRTPAIIIWSVQDEISYVANAYLGLFMEGA